MNIFNSNFLYYMNNPNIIIRTKGWGPFRKEWHSSCLIHNLNDVNCKLCQNSLWVNTWIYNINKFIYKLSPKLWKMFI